MSYEINVWSVLVASLASYIIAIVWYSSLLFGKQWLQMLNIKNEEVESYDNKSIISKYIIHFISTFISMSVVAFLVTFSGIITTTDGIWIGFIVWLGFVMTVSISDVLWRKTPFKLALIDSMQVLIGLMVGGAIIAGWQ